MTTALQIANYVKNEKFVYGAMHLQKLLYYSQAWSLVWTGKPLFADEIEAWPMGPVVRDVWVWDKYSSSTTHDAPVSNETRAIIDAVYEFYGSNGGAALSVMTHSEAPWLEARGDTPEGAHCSNPLAHATMRRYFTLVSMDSGKAPIRPLASHDASDLVVEEAGAVQRARWRTALDQLALV